MHDTDEANVKEVLSRYAAACNAGDFDTWLSLWAEDGVQMPPDTPARVGTEEIRAAMEPVFEEMDLDIGIHAFEDVKVVGDQALTRCTYSLQLTPKGGGETIDAMPLGKALTLYGRQSDGSWKIVYDCFNSSSPAE